MRDAAAIVGIHQTPFAAQLADSDLALATRAIVAALGDAGLTPRDVDGLVKNAMEDTEEHAVARALGIHNLRFFAQVPYGGGATCGMVAQAAAAIAAGLATTVVCWRVRKRASGGRPWAQGGQRVARDAQFAAPYGLLRPADQVALLMRRHMVEYGSTSAELGAIAVACRAHAARNPLAQKRAPITVADHQASRLVSEPLRLLDCCLESDGAAALVLTSTARARHGAQRPAVVRAATQATGAQVGRMLDWHKPFPLESSGRSAADVLYRQAGLGPQDIDCAQIYDSFTPFVLFALEDYGFCPRGEGGRFAADGRLQWPHGTLPVNTHGGSLSEGYIQGMNHLIEAVRQLRGTSTCQLPRVEHVLVTSSTSVPTSAVILGRVGGSTN
ncbi:MAG TPA: lipid-transfer protein [Candidatus Dormibacteraeota bacterium]|nr:lipid-transfer protein [Candidatus Dormibacteraeota bacterium]